MQEKKKKANETKQRRNSRKKKTTKEKAPAVETMQDEVPSVKTTQESKGDDQQASPLDEPGHIQAQAHGGEISQSAKAVPGRTRDNRRPPGPMQIGPHEKFADEDVGICQYAKNEEDCNFFPCNTHGSALAQNWVNREKFTEENNEIEDEHYGLDQIARKYGSGKRLMKINGETLCAVSQIPNEATPCEAHARVLCKLCTLAIAFVLDSASTIWVTNDVKTLAKHCQESF
jgi:hypothetical protein